MCVFMSGITVRGPWKRCHKEEVESRGADSRMGSWWAPSKLVAGHTLEETVFFYPYKCILRDRYDGNVFNSVRAKWSPGTARLVGSGVRTGKASAAAAPKSSLYDGADATAARGWRACAAEARSHEWTFLLTAGASWYCYTSIPTVCFIWCLFVC